MVLDFSRPWRIVPALPSAEPAGAPFPEPSIAADPASFAAAELAAVLGRIVGPAAGSGGAALPRAGAPGRGDGSESERVFFLHIGAPKAGEPAAFPSPFSWRAEPGRVEIYGETGRGLARGVYDFLDALGARWVEPGEGGERLPAGPILELAAASRRSPEGESAATLIIGHAAFFLRWREYLPWAARAGYASVFVHTTPDAIAFGAVPERLYERERGEFAAAARRLGLSVELGGHLLSSLLPRSLFKREPELFRERGAGAGGGQAAERSPDRNFCVSNPRALELASRNFAAFALAHPEVEVFHAWPDDLVDGGWCSCPACARLSPAAQSLVAAKALARALAEARPAADGRGEGDGLSPPPSPRLSFLAYHDTEDLAGLDLSGLPPNLELLWAPRRRCWAHGLAERPSSAADGSGGCALNASSSAAYRAATAAWAAAGGGGAAVFEYWEDAVLFKGAVPPLPRTMAGDLAEYLRAAPSNSGSGQNPPTPGRSMANRPSSVGILLTGGRLPLAPRPNPWLLPRLLRRAEEPGEAAARSAEELSDWIRATYGPAAEGMGRYWRALEAAWAIDLELEPGDSDTASGQRDPPVDWGDPWTASVERLAAKRGRCEELFDRLREAEAALAEAASAAGLGAAGAARDAALREADEYAIAGNLLELDCARLSAYHERAAGQLKAAADIALLASSPYSALLRALKRLPDPRSRREMRALYLVSYGARLRAIRREARANPLSRAAGEALERLGLAVRALRLRRAWE